MTQLCPVCREPLRGARHGKLRCPKCRTVYPRVPDDPDFLSMGPFKWLRVVRWGVIAVCSLLIILGGPLLPEEQDHKAAWFWANVSGTIAYATMAFTFVYWILYLRHMQKTLWRGTVYVDVARHVIRDFLKWGAFGALVATVLFLAVLRDSPGQVAALNLGIIVAAFVAHCRDA